jgi:hypothetical protein
MAINSLGAVLVPKPANLSFSEAIDRYRGWLDANHIDPLLFRSADLTDGTVGFEIVFRNEGDRAPGRGVRAAVLSSVSCLIRPPRSAD